MIEYEVPLLIAALMSYVGARFAMLAGWSPLAGALRLLALWTAASWAGYGTPIYVALLCLPLGILWAIAGRHLLITLAFELAFGAFLVWHCGTQIVVIYLVALALFDQLFTRLLLQRYDAQRETNTPMHRTIVIAAFIALGVLVWHYYRAPVISYATKHDTRQLLNLVPEGAAPLWFHKRVLTRQNAGDAQPGSVYWQARYPDTAERCVISFHGASSLGSLQTTARTISRATQELGWRMFAVDHPGFGASPTPPMAASIDAWDPAHLTTAVLEQTRVAGCKDLVVLGHSQGVTEALRLLTSNLPNVSNVLVLGAGLYTISEQEDEYWYSRFHIDRKLSDSSRVDRNSWKLIRDLYYLNQEYCRTSAAGSNYRDIKPFKFIQFEREHANLVETRETLWQCLDYPQAERLTLPTDHYLDSLTVGSMLFIQRSSPGVVARMFAAAAPMSEDDTVDEP